MSIGKSNTPATAKAPSSPVLDVELGDADKIIEYHDIAPQPRRPSEYSRSNRPSVYKLLSFLVSSFQCSVFSKSYRTMLFLHWCGSTYRLPGSGLLAVGFDHTAPVLLADAEIEVNAEPHAECVEVGVAFFDRRGTFSFEIADFKSVNLGRFAEEIPSVGRVAWIFDVGQVGG